MVCGLLVVATLGILPPPQSPRSATGYVATAKSRAGQSFFTDSGCGDEFVDDPLGDADRVRVRKAEDDVLEPGLDGVADCIAGGRNRLLVTSSPTRIRCVCAASADSSVHPS